MLTGIHKLRWSLLLQIYHYHLQRKLTNAVSYLLQQSFKYVDKYVEESFSCRILRKQISFTCMITATTFGGSGMYIHMVEIMKMVQEITCFKHTTPWCNFQCGRSMKEETLHFMMHILDSWQVIFVTQHLCVSIQWSFIAPVSCILSMVFWTINLQEDELVKQKLCMVLQQEC